MKTDAISIVEAAYDLEGDTKAWLSRVALHAAPAFDQGLGLLAVRIFPGAGGIEESTVVK